MFDARYGSLAQLKVPSWATSIVRNYRELAHVPESVNDVTLFVALESNEIVILDPEDQALALCDALGIEWKG
jgi:hypothetical protein